MTVVVRLRFTPAPMIWNERMRTSFITRFQLSSASLNSTSIHRQGRGLPGYEGAADHPNLNGPLI